MASNSLTMVLYVHYINYMTITIAMNKGSNNCGCGWYSAWYNVVKYMLHKQPVASGIILRHPYKNTQQYI